MRGNGEMSEGAYQSAVADPPRPVKGELIARPNGEAPALAPIPEPPAPPASYAQGFDGMAIAPFDKAIVAILMAPVNPEDVEIKPDGIVYLPGIFYRSWLMEAFGPGGWALAARRPPQTRSSSGGGELVVFYGALFALGRFVAEAGGQCTYWPKNRGMTYADALEGAKTDCITRCCKDLGIARELWDPGWRTQWQAKYARQVRDSKGEMKWERKGREQRLTSAPTAAAPSASSPPGSASVTSAPATQGAATGASDAAPSTDPSPPSDTGEAADDAAMDQLRELVGRLKWKAQFCKTWFTNRFGIWPPESLTKKQLETAFYLLEAWRGAEEAGHTSVHGGDLYQAALAKAKGDGRCR